AIGITKELGGNWRGSSGMARCPAHDDRNPSLSIAEKDGRVLVKCFAGCEQAAVISALKARNAWVGSRRATPVIEPFTRDQETRERVAAAKEIWASCQVGEHLTAYLNARSITLAVPPSLRFHPALLHTPTGLHLPAMVAAIQDSSRDIVAVQRTYLTGDCDKKADVSSPKMTLGPFLDGAVRLGPAGEVLGIAEGIETGLSAMQFCDVPVWAACGSRMHKVALPYCVREVHIFGDNGEPGHAAAEKAADRFTREGRRVLICYPVEQHGDWNDALCARRAA
ncbi:MAG: virulence-associated protein E, partial [Rhodospirillaceae bacterium]|nr:virulence-associated protein E [Rhodospirillaceae bacterium]